eukprot:12486019-Prorocentrum_lima.AAC.1
MKLHTIEEPEWMMHNTAHYQYHKIAQAILEITAKKRARQQQAEETKIPWRLNPDQELALQLQANFTEEGKTSSQQQTQQADDIHQLQQDITQELKKKPHQQ